MKKWPLWVEKVPLPEYVRDAASGRFVLENGLLKRRAHCAAAARFPKRIMGFTIGDDDEKQDYKQASVEEFRYNHEHFETFQEAITLSLFWCTETMWQWCKKIVKLRLPCNKVRVVMEVAEDPDDRFAIPLVTLSVFLRRQAGTPYRGARLVRKWSSSRILRAFPDFLRKRLVARRLREKRNNKVFRIWILEPKKEVLSTTKR